MCSEPQELTDEWQPYTGGYIKKVYSLRLKSGREITWAWPNAGMFHTSVLDEHIDPIEVTHVRLGQVLIDCMSKTRKRATDKVGKDNLVDVRSLLSAEEYDFVQQVYLNPGAKNRDCFHWVDDGSEHGKSISLWVKPEELGLIECVGGSRWRPANLTMQLYTKQANEQNTQTQNRRPVAG